MMRAAYICADPGISPSGIKGASVHVREVVRALARRGMGVEVFTVHRGGAPDDLAMHCFARVEGGDGPARERACLAANEALANALSAAEPYDLVYERFSLWSHAGMEFANARGIPGILEVNAPLLEEQARHRALHDRESAERSARRAMAAAAVIVAVSREVADWVGGFPGAAAKTHVVPNGVDLSRFHPGVPAALRGPAGAFVVGFVGSLKPWHGLEVLAESFARLVRRRPASRLLVVGDGPCRQSLAGDLGGRGVLDSVDWAGAVPAAEVPGLLRSMDAAVAPYPTADGFYFSPLKVFEAMAAGVPVVASAAGQLTEVIENGVTGLLCPAGDPIHLAAVLERLHDDPALRVRLGRAAWRRASVAYSWDRAVERILELACGPGLGRVA